MTKVSAAVGHRMWAPHYDDGPNPLLALESRLLEPVLGSCRSKRVLDVACGTGRWMRYFAQHETSAFGVDICPEMLQEASRNNDGQTRLALGDALHLPFAGASASLVLCSFALGYIADLNVLFFEAARVAEAYGNVVVSDLHPDAIAAGWARSFKLDGCSYDIDHYVHSELSIFRAARSAGLSLEGKLEACLGKPEFPILQRAGKAALFENLCKVPAIWVAIWKKPC